MPHGRVAYFTGWKFLGIDKDGWDNLHVIFGFLMVIVAVWHILVNWKPLKKYLLQKESFIALGIVAIIFFGTIKNFYPFKLVSDLEENIKNSWEVSKAQIPIAHGELLSLKEFCKKTDIPLNVAVEKLKKANIKFSLEETLKEIAAKNNTTPYKIYEIIKQKNTSFFVPQSGFGRMTLIDFCKKNNLDVKKAIEILKKRGIEAKKEDTLRDIAFKNNLTPIDIAQILNKGEK
jgi:hypothetical protein